MRGRKRHRKKLYKEVLAALKEIGDNAARTAPLMRVLAEHMREMTTHVDAMKEPDHA